MSLGDLLNMGLISRNVSFDHIVKQGIDGGKSFLKFCFWVVDRNPFTEELEKSAPQK